MPRSKRSARLLGYTKAARSLLAHADSRKALVQRGFFKDPGDDIFLGVSTPILRGLAREFRLLPLSDVRRLMRSRVHDERSLAYAILRRRFEKGNEAEREAVFNFYLRNRRLVRSWDAVDDSAPNIVGPYLFERDKKVLYRLAESSSLWDRRIAMVSTLPFIRRGHITDALKLAEILLADEERTDPQGHRLDAARSRQTRFASVEGIPQDASCAYAADHVALRHRKISGSGEAEVPEGQNLDLPARSSILSLTT
jgi:3-methyladenine DNA glycosylase AlkD